MSDLDDKLRQLFDEHQVVSDWDKLTKQIKQAFSEAGYMQVFKPNGQFDIPDQLFTGQEWYDLFLIRLGSIPPELLHDDYLWAAKKAAGL